MSAAADSKLHLAELAVGSTGCVTRVTGQGSFRRRLLELGILPGTRVEVVGVAPLGDPIELLVRGSSLSIRRTEAASVEVTRVSEQSERALKDGVLTEAVRRGQQ